LENNSISLYSYLLTMLVSLLFYTVFGMILLGGTSRYFFVSCVPEDDTGLGSLVFVSAVSI
jgi:TRAP-type C4-dicarboxylate transport system permease small subunit